MLWTAPPEIFIELAVVVLHQCIRPLLEHLLLAIMDISAPAISLADRPEPAIRVTSVRGRREDRPPSQFDSLADLGGTMTFDPIFAR
jgi:hypothetical protein